MRPIPRTVLWLAILLTACSGGGPDTQPGDVTLDDPLVEEAVLTFEEVPEEYLLVRPLWQSLAVEADGDLLVVDEDYVKVYAPDGSPKERFGGPGSGPGELERVRSIWIGPKGHITLFGGGFGFTAHYFQPDYTFMERVNYMSAPPYADHLDTLGLQGQRPQVIYRLDEQRLLYVIRSVDQDRTQREHQELSLFLQEGEQVREIARYPDTSMIYGERISLGFSYLGQLLVVPLGPDRIAYTHSAVDRDMESDPPAYIIHLLELASDEHRAIRRTYRPQPVDYEVREYSEEFQQRSPEQYRMQMEMEKKAVAYFEQHPYMVGLSDLLADGQTLFAFTFTRDDSSRALVDVFDTRPGNGNTSPHAGWSARWAWPSGTAASMPWRTTWRRGVLLPSPGIGWSRRSTAAAEYDDGGHTGGEEHVGGEMGPIADPGRGDEDAPSQYDHPGERADTPAAAGDQQQGEQHPAHGGVT